MGDAGKQRGHKYCLVRCLASMTQERKHDGSAHTGISIYANWHTERSGAKWNVYLRACKLVLCPSVHCRPAYRNWWLRHCSSANRYCHSGLDVPSSTLGCQGCLLTTWMKSMMVLGHPVLPCSLLLFGFSHYWIRNLHYPRASCSTYLISARSICHTRPYTELYRLFHQHTVRHRDHSTRPGRNRRNREKLCRSYDSCLSPSAIPVHMLGNHCPVLTTPPTLCMLPVVQCHCILSKSEGEKPPAIG